MGTSAPKQCLCIGRYTHYNVRVLRTERNFKMNKKELEQAKLRIAQRDTFIAYRMLPHTDFDSAYAQPDIYNAYDAVTSHLCFKWEPTLSRSLTTAKAIAMCSLHGHYTAALRTRPVIAVRNLWDASSFYATGISSIATRNGMYPEKLWMLCMLRVLDFLLHRASNTSRALLASVKTTLMSSCVLVLGITYVHIPCKTHRKSLICICVTLLRTMHHTI